MRISIVSYRTLLEPMHVMHPLPAFTGHGGQKKDWTFKERDGKNEMIIPSDYHWYRSFRRGSIVDDELNKRLIRPLPSGCVLHCLTDTCHSGTNLDLPEVYRVCEKTPQHDVVHRKEEGRWAATCFYSTSWRLLLS